MQETTKRFDCVRMKREAQEQITRETEGMSPEQRAGYFNDAADRYRAGRPDDAGKGNFKALFETLEIEQDRRGGGFVL